MPMNRVQFQPGMSMPEFFERFGTAPQRSPRKRWLPSDGRVDFAARVRFQSLLVAALAHRQVGQLVELVHALVVDLGTCGAQQVADAPGAKAPPLVCQLDDALARILVVLRVMGTLSLDRLTKAQTSRSPIEVGSNILPTARRFTGGLGALRRRLPSVTRCPARSQPAAS